MIEALTGMGYAIIGLAIMIGIGIVILTTLGANIASTSPSANATVQTLAGYLGTSSGGLGSWVPIIIVLVIGMLFLGYFMGKKGVRA